MSGQSVTSSLVSAHDREHNLTSLCEDTISPEVHVCSLASSAPLELVPAGESISLTSPSHGHGTRQASEPQEKGICQSNCHQLLLCCPEETQTQCLSNVAQRLLLLAGFVFGTNSSAASHCKELDVPAESEHWGSTRQ